MIGVLVALLLLGTLIGLRVRVARRRPTRVVMAAIVAIAATNGVLAIAVHRAAVQLLGLATGIVLLLSVHHRAASVRGRSRPTEPNRPEPTDDPPRR